MHSDVAKPETEAAGGEIWYFLEEILGENVISFDLCLGVHLIKDGWY